MKGRFYIKPIRRIEVDALRKAKLGKYVRKTYSKNPKYYAIEDKRVLRFLEKFNQSIKQK